MCLQLYIQAALGAAAGGAAAHGHGGGAPGDRQETQKRLLFNNLIE